jgi:hypothetical protein
MTYCGLPGFNLAYHLRLSLADRTWIGSQTLLNSKKTGWKWIQLEQSGWKGASEFRNSGQSVGHSCPCQTEYYQHGNGSVLSMRLCF